MAEFEKTRKLDGLQPPYHLFRREFENEILPYCQEHGIGVVVYGPIAYGLLYGNMTSGTQDDLRHTDDIMRGAVMVGGPSPEGGV